MKPKSLPFNRGPFNPAWRVPQDPVTDTTNKKPNLVVAMGFVEYGYQVDYYINGEYVGTECSDFGDNYKIPELEARFVTAIQEAIRKTKREL